MWSEDPRVEWALEILVFLIAGWVVWRQKRLGETLPRAQVSLSLLAIAIWGLIQVGLDRWGDTTVYTFATISATLRFAAMAATFLIAYLAIPRWAIQRWLLPAVAWLGFSTAIVSVLAYYGSPGNILWMFPSPYPDVWGPFLSRNHFAQFLELCFPAALWLWSPLRPTGMRRAAEGSSLTYGLMALVILAAGFASSSRAGALLLSAELVVFAALKIRSHGMPPRRGKALWTAGLFLAGFLILAGIAGGSRVLHRFAEANPFAMRDEIYRSAAEMISERPLRGYGLGTFADVYPAFAYFDSGQRVTHAHNDWLEWTAEGGIGFLAAWFVLWASLAPLALRHFWGVGVIAVLLHALVDYPFATLGIALWVLFLAGALEKNRSDAPLPQRRTV